MRYNPSQQERALAMDFHIFSYTKCINSLLLFLLFNHVQKKTYW